MDLRGIFSHIYEWISLHIIALTYDISSHNVDSNHLQMWLQDMFLDMF